VKTRFQAFAFEWVNLYRYTTAPRSEYVKKAPKERTAGAAAAGNTSFSLFSAPEPKVSGLYGLEAGGVQLLNPADP
jgi:hypothetical protein